MNNVQLSTIKEAISAFRSGQFVIIVDDEDRENEGDLVLAADCISTETVNFMATHGRGLICLAMQAALLDRLNIPMMVPDVQNSSGFGTGFTVSVEAIKGVSTGISAADRAQTIKTMIDPCSTSADIAMPGHIFPLRARDGGVLERRGQTEASVDLAKLAGLTPAGVICEVMNTDGSMMRLPGLLKFAQQYNMPVISVEALARHMNKNGSNVLAKSNHPPGTGTGNGNNTRASASTKEFSETLAQLVIPIGESDLPTAHGKFRISIFRDQQGLEHSAMIMGNTDHLSPLVRLHSECLTGDAFGSLRCDCGDQLQSAMARIAKAGKGILLYLRQEGRGIGLGNKIKAYALQDTGTDTVDANHQLGFPADARHYDVASAILRHLQVSSVRLLTNNPTKRTALQAHGIDVVEQLPLVIPAQAINAAYLRTKVDRMGHVLDPQQSEGSEVCGEHSAEQIKPDAPGSYSKLAV